MVKDKLAGHLAIAATYTIFGLNLIFCKDIANAEAVSPIVLFTLRAAGASALFWLLSLFLPGERIAKGDPIADMEKGIKSGNCRAFRFGGILRLEISKRLHDLIALA